MINLAGTHTVSNARGSNVFSANAAPFTPMPVTSSGGEQAPLPNTRLKVEATPFTPMPVTGSAGEQAPRHNTRLKVDATPFTPNGVSAGTGPQTVSNATGSNVISGTQPTTRKLLVDRFKPIAPFDGQVVHAELNGRVPFVVFPSVAEMQRRITELKDAMEVKYQARLATNPELAPDGSRLRKQYLPVVFDEIPSTATEDHLTWLLYQVVGLVPSAASRTRPGRFTCYFADLYERKAVLRLNKRLLFDTYGVWTPQNDDQIGLVCSAISRATNSNRTMGVELPKKAQQHQQRSMLGGTPGAGMRSGPSPGSQNPRRQRDGPTLQQILPMPGAVLNVVSAGPSPQSVSSAKIKRGPTIVPQNTHMRRAEASATKTDDDDEIYRDSEVVGTLASAPSTTGTESKSNSTLPQTVSNAAGSNAIFLTHNTRLTANATPFKCCILHNAPNNMPEHWQEKYLILFQGGSGNPHPITRLVLTAGLQTFVDQYELLYGPPPLDQQVCLCVDSSDICRMVDKCRCQLDKCGFGEECKLIHLCKELLDHEVPDGCPGRDRQASHAPQLPPQQYLEEEDLSFVPHESLKAIIQGTMDALGPLISTPKLTWRLLSKPSFRFLLEIIVSVNAEHPNVFQTELFSKDLELTRNKGNRIIWLERVFAEVGAGLGRPVNCAPYYTIAGMQPERTNSFLQDLAALVTKHREQQHSTLNVPAKATNYQS